MKKRFLCLLLLIFAVALLAGCSNSNRLRLGTGNVGGKYYSFGNTLKDSVDKGNYDFTLEVKETAGSAANLRLIGDGFVDAAIVQSDILSDAQNGTGLFLNNAISGLTEISNLYIEQCQIVIPAGADIHSLSDLAGKKLAIGEAESGVSVIAKLILQAAGIKKEAAELINLSFKDSAKALKDGEIDAFFIMAGAPVEILTELADETDIRLLPLDEHIISYMTGLYDGYVKASIPANTYKGVSEDIPTIGVQAVLVAGKKVSEKNIEVLKGIVDANSSF